MTTVEGIATIAPGAVDDDDSGNSGEQKCDYTELYPKISEEISNIICKGIYTNTKDGTNLTENINKVITQKVIDTISTDDIKIKIQDIIFGNDDNINPKGLRKYIQDLIKVSAGNDKDQIYAFTGRILQKVFHPEDTTIDDLLNSDEIKKVLNDGVVKDNDIIQMMKTEILKTLEATLKGGVFNDSNPTTESVPNNKPDFLGSIRNSFNFPEVPKENNCKKEQPPPLPAPIELKEITVAPGSQLNDFLNTSNDIQNHIVAEIERSVNTDRIQYMVNIALDKIIKAVLGNISNTVSDTIIHTYTDAIINNKTVKLQIFYSIISYDPSKDNGEYGNKLENNTLYIAKELFTKALAKKRSKEGNQQKLVRILYDLITEEIATRGGDLLGRSVSAINSLVNTKINGGITKRRNKKSGNKRKTKKTRKNQTRKNKKIQNKIQNKRKNTK